MGKIFVVVVMAWRIGVARADGVELDTARALLPGAAECADIPCLIGRAYRGDPAGEVALGLWRDRGDVAGVGPDEHMDGGYRGMIHLVPALPIGRDRRHLVWVAAALRGFDELMASLFADQPAPRY
ncbi:MAG TPA: hypothetical protein VGC42_19585, partial [Kofleriaceae bacterium]